MTKHGIIFGGMINSDEPLSVYDIDGVNYSNVHRNTGSHRIATYLRQNGLDVEVVDFAASWKIDEFKELIKSRVRSDTIFVGLGALFNLNTQNLINCFSWLKSSYPDILVITGAQDFYNTHLIPTDYMVTGWGEYAILEILKGTARHTEEVIDRQGNKVRTVNALNEYPAYPMTNLSIDYEHRDFLQPYEFLTIETSRGCRFKCDFCTYPVLGVKKDHTRSATDFHDNLIRMYDQFGITRYGIADDTFNDYTDKIKKYADIVEKLPFDTVFGGHVRIDLLHARKQDIEHLARMNFNLHFYGIESFNHDSAKSVGKGLHPDKVKETLLSTQEYFLRHNNYYRGAISFIAGLPYETLDTLQESVDWAIKHWKTNRFAITPLLLPTTHGNVKQSVLSSNYQKQGYTIVENSENSLLFNDGIEDELKNYAMTLNSLLKPNERFHIWENNMGMTMHDALTFIVNNVYSHDEYLDFGVDFFRFAEWFVAGKSLDDMLGSYKSLGGIRPPVETKVNFIEDYKKKKLEHREKQ